MTRTLRVSPRARLDLLDIWDYIALDSPARADALLDRVQSAFELLRSRPRIGVARDEIHRGIRSHAVGSYVIFYRIGAGEKAIEIVRVLHGARDAMTFL